MTPAEITSVQPFSDTRVTGRNQFFIFSPRLCKIKQCNKYKFYSYRLRLSDNVRLRYFFFSVRCSVRRSECFFSLQKRICFQRAAQQRFIVFIIYLHFHFASYYRNRQLTNRGPRNIYVVFIVRAISSVPSHRSRGYIIFVGIVAAAVRIVDGRQGKRGVHLALSSILDTHTHIIINIIIQISGYKNNRKIISIIYCNICMIIIIVVIITRAHLQVRVAKARETDV